MEQTNPVAQPEKKDLFWWIVGGSVAAVLGVGTFVYLLFSKKEEPKKEEPKKEEPKTEAPAQKKDAA